jgi:hypothetical protein
MNKLMLYLMLGILCIGDLCFLNFMYHARSAPSLPPPRTPSVEEIYLTQISSLLGQASAAAKEGNNEHAAVLYIQATIINVSAARDVKSDNAAMFDPGTAALLAKEEWSLAHPDSTQGFNQVVDLLVKDAGPSAVAHPPAPSSRP